MWLQYSTWHFFMLFSLHLRVKTVLLISARIYGPAEPAVWLWFPYRGNLAYLDFIKKCQYCFLHQKKWCVFILLGLLMQLLVATIQNGFYQCITPYGLGIANHETKLAASAQFVRKVRLIPLNITSSEIILTEIRWRMRIICCRS